MTHAFGSGPSVEGLFALLPPADDLPRYDVVPAEAVPPPYDQLLVHKHHMTVTLESYYNDMVDVRVLAAVQGDDWYARKILLTLHGDGRVVLFGIVRILFRYCSPAVRDEIVAGKTPLGRVLIQHRVLRRIEPTAYLRVVPGPAMMGYFGLKEAVPLYGRLAYIHCDNQPAVELLEIVGPDAS
ncbi:MAG: hypothetical protein NZ700_17980 [Gemmataceae bacterium]|nr:hypothetical protein [Gemmataceae bacterium]MDW8267120.1 hypothetical protein [Gemmataceae bacterium]